MESQLTRWLAEEEAVRALHTQGRAKAEIEGQAAQGPQGLQALATLDGLSLMRAVLEGRFAPPSIGRTLDFMMVSVESGRAVFQGSPGAGHLNPMGTVHGGWFATLLDSALGCSVHSALPAGRGYTTLELKVNMIRALTPKVQRVRAEGQVIHVGNQTATAEARLIGPDGKLYGHATTTCLVFALPPVAAAV
jgi:uncharacterized protein (TIGR00369 family)